MTTENSCLFPEWKNDRLIRSPLFYVGDKYKLLKEIKKYFPLEINKFIEPFVGGGSVFLNVEAESYYLNDIDSYLVQIHQFLCKKAHHPEVFFREIEFWIEKYGFSYSFKQDIVPKELKLKHKKTYYAHFNKTPFEKLKADFNQSGKSDMLKLYLLLIYGFNRMLRFNAKGDFNVPVGNVDFNKNVFQALQNYFEVVKNRKIEWFNQDYRDFLKELYLTSQDFIYLDPPYLITFSEYNKLWTQTQEKELIKALNELHQKGLRFAISNVISYKGKVNEIFKIWAKNFTIIPIQSNYISYHDNSHKKFEEVLVCNYL